MSSPGQNADSELLREQVLRTIRAAMIQQDQQIANTAVQTPSDTANNAPAQTLLQHTGTQRDADAYEKREKVRLKNRLAQQRFRDRKRKTKEETQQRFDTLGAQIEALEAENDLLRENQQLMSKLFIARSAVLEALTLKATTQWDIGTDALSTTQKETLLVMATLSFSESHKPTASAADTPTTQVHQPIDAATTLNSPLLDTQTKHRRSFEEWQTEIRQLMQKTVEDAFSPPAVTNLTVAVQRQLNAWTKMAQHRSSEFVTLLGSLLPPSGMSSTPRPTTCKSVVTSLPASVFEHLEQQLVAYHSVVVRSLNCKLIDWQKSALPLLLTSAGGWTQFMAFQGVATAQLHSLLNDIRTAVCDIGTCWFQVGKTLLLWVFFHATAS